jgi:hypothetical protein
LLPQLLRVVASILRSLLHSRQNLFVGPIVDHLTLRHRDQSSLATGIALSRIFSSANRRVTPCKFCFCITDGFHPILFLRDRIHLEELAAINREEAEREERRTSIPSGYCELSQYWLPDDPMSTPGPQPQPQPQPPTSPIPDDDDSVAIDTGDVDLDESDPSRRVSDRST